MSEIIQKSGYFYPNEFSRISLNALAEIIGHDGLVEVLTEAHLSSLLENPIPNNLDQGLDFSEYSQIQKAITDVYGPRGGRGLAVRLGNYIYRENYRRFRIFSRVGNQPKEAHSTTANIRRELWLLANFFTQMSDQITSVNETDEYFVYSVHRCPECWGRIGARHPICYLTIGFLQEGLKRLNGDVDFVIEEHRCLAMADDRCEFLIEKITEQ